MRSVPLQEAYVVAEAYSAQLDKVGRETRKMDPRFNLCVFVRQEDGTTFFFRNAFVVKWASWHFVFPEHHDILVFANDEIEWISQLREDNEAVETLQDPATLGVDISQFKFDHSNLRWTP